MKLRIDNFALIKHAEIDIDGITVIAGNNNSGKSTVGKILFSMFNALNNLDDKIKQQREELVTDAVRFSFYESEKSEHLASRYSVVGYIVKQVLDDISKGEIKWPTLFSGLESNYDLALGEETKAKIQKEVENVCNWPKERLLMDSLRASYLGVFNNQLNSLYHLENEATVDLFIKDTRTSIAFRNNDVVRYSSDITLINKAIYYSTPLVIDAIGSWRYSEVQMKHLSRLLSDYGYAVTDDENLYAQSLQLGRLENVISKIKSVVPGQLVKDGHGYALKLPNCGEPIVLKNLSTGIKAFMVLRMLIEASLIKKRDILILDEPEIHLHPTWQLIYAELIVLLQKEFDLSIVITTHSPFFLNAIQTYSKKYDTTNKLRLYVSEVSHDGVTMRDATATSEVIYSKMAEALDSLTSTEFEL